MRTLTETLQTAQRASSRAPYVQCVVDDRPCNSLRFSWASLYSGTEEDFVNDAAVYLDGSIFRVRLQADGMGRFDVYWQRVTSPTTPAQWSTWSTLVNDVSADGVAVACSDAQPLVAIFWIRKDGLAVLCKRSTDGGSSWGGTETVYTFVAGVVRAVGADWRDGDEHCLFTYDPLGVDPDDYLLCANYSGGAWQAPVADLAQRYTGIRSIGVASYTDGTLQVCISHGVDPELELGVRQFDRNAGTFSGSYTVLAPGSGSGYGYRHPKVLGPWTNVPPAADVPRWFYSYTEQVGADYRCWMGCTPDRGWPGEMLPLNVASGYGAKLLLSAGYWYLLGASFAWRSAAYTGGSGDVVDVSAAVRGVEIDEPSGVAGLGLEGLMRGSRLVVRLDNAEGAYGTAGQSGANEPLREGSRLALGLGYLTTAGNERVWWAPYWIEGVVFADEKGEGIVELACIDAWEVLDRVAIPRTASFSGQSLQTILRRALWPVGDVGATSLHTNLSTTVPLFTFAPGESFGSAARRVLRLAGLGLRFNTTGSTGCGWDTVGVAVYAYGSGSSGYSYGPSAHKVQRGRYGSGAQRLNGVYVAGTGAQAFRYDYTHTSTVGHLHFGRIFDRQWGTTEECGSRGDRALELAQAAGSTGLLEAAANVGLELGDVVDVTDARAGLAAAARRVVGIETVYDRKRGRFDQRVRLAGV